VKSWTIFLNHTDCHRATIEAEYACVIDGTLVLHDGSDKGIWDSDPKGPTFARATAVFQKGLWFGFMPTPGTQEEK